MKNRNYSESEKSAAVNRFLVNRESVADIASDTGISRSTLYAWIKSAQTDPASLKNNFTLGHGFSTPLYLGRGRIARILPQIVVAQKRSTVMASDSISAIRSA